MEGNHTQLLGRLEIYVERGRNTLAVAKVVFDLQVIWKISATPPQADAFWIFFAVLAVDLLEFPDGRVSCDLAQLHDRSVEVALQANLHGGESRERDLV